MKRQMPSEPVVPGMVLPLSSEEATLDRAGDKGANLASLARAGFEVPPGFIVTTDAYRGYVNASGIGPWVVGLAKAASPDDLDALESISNEIRRAVRRGDSTCGNGGDDSGSLHKPAWTGRRISAGCRPFVRHHRRLARLFIRGPARDLSEHRWSRRAGGGCYHLTNPLSQR